MTFKYFNHSINKPKFGFDIDGVLQPDLEHTEVVDLSVVLYARQFFKPLLTTNKAVALITGRPICDFEDTKKWALQYFKDFELYHSTLDRPLNDKQSVELKARVIAESELTFFIESNPAVSEAINVSLKRKVSFTLLEVFQFFVRSM